MRCARFVFPWVLSAVVLLAAGPAFANVCRAIQQELQTLGRGGSVASQQAAQRAAQEANRLWAHMRSIGCDRQPFLFLGTPPPPECQGLRARLGALQAQSQVASNGGDARRRQLLSLQITHNCQTSPDPVAVTRSEPLTAGLFDPPARSRAPRSELVSDDLASEPRMTPRVRSLRNAVCVRLCDGSFFPVQVSRDQLEDDPDQPCRSTCPASEARLYFMRGEDIANAVSADGEPYRNLTNALRYRRSFDPACTCRRPGMMQTENSILEVNPDGGAALRTQGFSLINPDQEMDMPSEFDDPSFLRGPEGPAGRTPDRSVFGRRKPPEPPAPPHPPADVPADRMVTQEQGEIREATRRDGTKRSVRVIAPELSPAPSEVERPLIPGRGPVR